MKMKFYFPRMISLFVVGLLMLTACGGGSSDPDPDPEPVKDTTKPVIATTTPVANAQIGTTLPFMYKGTFTDDTELLKVVFSLKDQKPAGVASLKAATGTGDDPWTPEAVTVTLSGKSQTVDQAIFSDDYKDNASDGVMGIPSGIYTGTYTLTVTCTDKADNISSEDIDVDIF